MTTVLFLLFVLASILNITGEFTPYRMKIRYITTPLIIPTLAFYIFSSRGEIYPLILGALACGWIGDILLMFRDNQKRCIFFIQGLVIFFVGHCLYLIAFSSRLINQWRAIEPISWFLALFIFIGSFFYLIKNRKKSGKLFLAVLSYGIILAILCSVSILSFYSQFILTSLFAIAGTLLFMGSDIVLSTHQFIKKIKFERPIAMITYILAQFAITVSLTGTYPHPWY